MPDVLTMGSFDTMHPGHIRLLRQCRELTWELGRYRRGKLFIYVNTDEFITRFKGVVPIFTAYERVEMAVTYVDGIELNDGDDQPALILRALRHGGLLVIGDDWKDRDYLAQIGLAGKPTWLADHGIELVYVPRHGDWSTTAIRQRVLDRG